MTGILRTISTLLSTAISARSSGSPSHEAAMLTSAAATANNSCMQSLPSIRFVSHQDPESSHPSLEFSAISRTLPTLNSVIRVGRYSERDKQPQPSPDVPSSASVGFKSKVVSRQHCEFWFSNSQWYIKDVQSSSGTFVNHVRLSLPNEESNPWPVNDGDIIQLGIDFKGGEEKIFRCVKIRIEVNRAWQKELNAFNKTTHKRLRNLRKTDQKDTSKTSMSSSECSICLMTIAPCQSLFVAPCSHVWHYKCIRPILTGPSFPNFLCPNCRAISDLETDIDFCLDYDDEDDEKGKESSVEDELLRRRNQEGNNSQSNLNNPMLLVGRRSAAESVDEGGSTSMPGGYVAEGAGNSVNSITTDFDDLHVSSPHAALLQPSSSLETSPFIHGRRAMQF